MSNQTPVQTLVAQIEEADARAKRYLMLARKLRLQLKVKADVRMIRAPYFRRRYVVKRQGERSENARGHMHMTAWKEALER